MTPDDWFEQLAAALPAGAAPLPALTADERGALLDLARIAAHGSERWTAPLSTFLVGAALHALPSEQRAAALRDLVSRLEPLEPNEA